MLLTASWIVFASDMILSCRMNYNAPRDYPIYYYFCLSLLSFLIFLFMISLSKYHTIYRKEKRYKCVCHYTNIALTGSLLRRGIPTNLVGFGLTTKNPPTQKQLG